MTMRATTWLAIIAGLIAAVAAHAEDVYKWVDDQGQVHFGSQPPAGVKARKMGASAAEPASESPQQPAQASWRQQLGKSNLQRLQKQQQDEQAAQKEQQLTQRCLSAQKEVDSLTRRGAVYRVNTQGEREYLSDAERQTALEAANQRVGTYCR